VAHFAIACPPPSGRHKSLSRLYRESSYTQGSQFSSNNGDTGMCYTALYGITHMHDMTKHMCSLPITSHTRKKRWLGIDFACRNLVVHRPLRTNKTSLQARFARRPICDEASFIVPSTCRSTHGKRRRHRGILSDTMIKHGCAHTRWHRR